MKFRHRWAQATLACTLFLIFWGGLVRVRPAAATVSGAVFVQLVLGAIMRHIDRGQGSLAIPDFPLALGRIIPPLDSPRVAIHFAHRVWAIVVVVLIVRLLVCVVR